MTFNIHILQRSKLNFDGNVGEIVLGEHKETFPLITTRWSIADYCRQWIGAVEGIVSGHVAAGILVVDIQPPKISRGITYWAMFRENGQVYLQERIMRIAPKDNLLTQPKLIESSIPPRIQGTMEEHSQVSEWVLDIHDFENFLKSNASEVTGSGLAIRHFK